MRSGRGFQFFARHDKIKFCLPREQQSSSAFPCPESSVSAAAVKRIATAAGRQLGSRIGHDGNRRRRGGSRSLLRRRNRLFQLQLMRWRWPPRRFHGSSAAGSAGARSTSSGAVNWWFQLRWLRCRGRGPQQSDGKRG